jgi:hypothetical protein
LEIALVYLGRNKLPRYVLDNINYLKINFPEHSILLISDNEESLRSADISGVNTFKCPDYKDYLSESYFSSGQDLGFRNGFWFLTFARFFALQDYMVSSNVGNLLHLESDVLLLRTFPFEKLDKIEGLGFPLVNPGYAAASSLYIKDAASIQILCEITKQLLLLNPLLTDMDILGSKELLETGKVTYLPSSTDTDSNFESWVPPLTRQQMSSQAIDFGGLFDGMTWGQFLTGEDPRNHYGFRPIYRIQKHHSVKMQQFTFKLENGCLIVEDKGGQIAALHSLHIHSKDRRYFRSDASVNLLSKRVREVGSPKLEYQLLLVIRMLPLRVRNTIKVRVRLLYQKLMPWQSNY